MKVHDWLAICDIGGLGEPAISATRFYTYYLEVNQGFAPLLIPECEIDDPPGEIQKYYLNGQQLLISLYNLYEDILPYEDDPVISGKRVIHWCSRHAHPYDIRKIRDSIPNMADFAEPPDSFVSLRSWYEQKSQALRDLARINLYSFCSDLRGLYERTKTYAALTQAGQGDFKMLEQVSRQVLHHRSENNEIAGLVMAKGEVTADFMDRYARSVPGVDVALHYDHSQAGFYLAPRLDSVFAIANYALLRMMATNAPNLDFSDSKTAVSFCESCGKMFVKTGNRQKVCSNEECQKARNARKAAAFRQRRKVKGQ